MWRPVPTRGAYNWPTGISRRESADGNQPTRIGRFPSSDSIGDQILNMFHTDSRPTLGRVGHRFYKAHTHTPIVEELVLELALYSADYSSKSVDFNAYPAKFRLWVRALNLNNFDQYNLKIITLFFRFFSWVPPSLLLP